LKIKVVSDALQKFKFLPDSKCLFSVLVLRFISGINSDDLRHSSFHCPLPAGKGLFTFPQRREYYPKKLAGGAAPAFDEI